MMRAAMDQKKSFHRTDQACLKLLPVSSSKTHQLVLRSGNMKIPLKKKNMHAGIFLSYDRFERQTVEVRVQAGWNNFKRLQPWFCRKHQISLKLRMELMTTCIIPTIFSTLGYNRVVYISYARLLTRCIAESLATCLTAQEQLIQQSLNDFTLTRHWLLSTNWPIRRIRV